MEPSASVVRAEHNLITVDSDKVAEGSVVVLKVAGDAQVSKAIQAVAPVSPVQR